MTTKKKTDWGFVSHATVAIVAGVLAAYFGGPLIHDNDSAVNVIVTTFSVLAGFLIAIMTILLDPSALLPGTWRIASAQRQEFHKRLLRHKWLFFLYVWTLGLIFLATLIEAVWPDVARWLEHLYLGFAVACFVLSLALPSALLRIQSDRVEAVIAARIRAAKGGSNGAGDSAAGTPQPPEPR